MELEPEPKLWTKVEPEPESEPKINNFVSATLGNNISSESFWNDDAADSLSFTARDADAQNSSKGGLHQCCISGSGQIRTFMTRFRVFFRIRLKNPDHISINVQKDKNLIIFHETDYEKLIIFHETDYENKLFFMKQIMKNLLFFMKQIMKNKLFFIKQIMKKLLFFMKQIMKI